MNSDIQEIMGVIKKASAGDLSVRFNMADRNSELYSLAESLNSLLASFEKKEEERKSIEKKLKKLTEDAFWASEELKARNEEYEEYAIILESQKKEIEKHTAGLEKMNHRLQLEISEHKLTEKKLNTAKNEALAASRTKSEFLANMSHEIRTPMNGVIGMTALLLNTDLTGEQRKYLKIVKNSADHLLTVINDILDYSKIEAGKLEITAYNFDLRSMIEDVTDVVAVLAHKKGLEFVFHIHPEVPTHVCGDAGRLRQILINLVNNAVKFTEEGEVKIEAVLDEDADSHALVHFKVTDTGMGIPKEKKDLLFKSFSQVDASNTRKYGGTGLGLAISKKLVEMMGGEIGVKSREGEGSTFWFTTKLKKTLEEPSRHLSKQCMEDDRILIVDDNVTNRIVLKEYLKSWTCEYEEAAGGEEALEILRREAEAGRPFNIAILDMQMPGMDGAILGKKIKEDRKISDTILIMLSSLGIENDEFMTKETGFYAHLTKPVKISQLYNCLMSAKEGKAPLDDAGSEPVAKEQPVVKNRDVRILLVEDNLVNQKVAAKLLEKSGYHADIANNGLEAVELLGKSVFDLVFMDVQMPKMDGLEATRTIRSGARGIKNTKVPIIAMTARVMEEDQQDCLDAGMNDYISKPINPDELVNKILKWAENTNGSD